MRKLALVLTALLAACSGTEPADPELRLALRLDRSMVLPGDSVRVTLTMTNSSPRTMKVFPAEAYGICMHAFDVTDAWNQPVAVAQGFCVAVSLVMPRPVDLLPMEQIVITDWWRPDQSTLNGAPLMPGAYRVRGRAWADEQPAYSGSRTVLLQ